MNCRICDRGFKRRSDLGQHLHKTHGLDKIGLNEYHKEEVSIDKNNRHQCQLCSKEFERISGIRKHVTYKHRDCSNYWDDYFPVKIDIFNLHQCQLCGKRIGSGNGFSGFSNHILNSHGDISWSQYKERYFPKKMTKLRKIYLRKIFSYEDKHCLWCGNETDFINSVRGYKRFCKKCLQESKHPTQLKYWFRIKNVESEEEAKELMKIWRHENMPMYKEYYIKRNLTEEDRLQYNKKQNHISNIKRSNFSKISQELYKEIYQNSPNDIKGMKIYFASKKDDEFLNISEMTSKENNEYQVWCLSSKDWEILGKSGTFLDFYIKDLNIDIEFDGTYWHKENDDHNRDQWLSKRLPGIEIVRVTEDEYMKDKNKIVEFCVKKIINKYGEIKCKN